MVTTQETGTTAVEPGTDDTSLPQQAMGEARALADEAKRTGADLGRDARQQLRAQADQQAARVAGSLHQLAAQFDQMSGAGGSGMATDLARDAGSRLDSLATRLDREGLESVLGEAKRFARNRPGTFLLLAAAAGAVAARVLKATDTQGLVDAAKGEAPAGAEQPPNGWGSTGSTPTTAPASLTSAPVGELAGR